MNDPLWSVPKASPAAAPGQVDLWRVDLAADEARVAELTTLLSPEELARAGRFLADRERRRYIVARATLRSLLGSYLSMKPEGVRLEEEENGKPHLRGRELEFNVTHSAELALIAVSARGRVGVDLERVRPVGQSSTIARRWFSPAEQRLIDEAPDRVRAFLACWTSKEAQVKAVGAGVWSLESADVWRAVPRRHYTIDHDLARGSWTLQQIEPASGFVGALVVEGEDGWDLRYFTL